METCLICFDDYRIENTKDHQCKEDWFCNACAEYCLLEDGKVTLEKNEVIFTHSSKLCGAQDENISTEEIIEEVTSILQEYSDITKRFWKLYEELDDETADKLTKAGAEKWLKYAFTLSMDELWFESMSWELTKEDMEIN
jgi:hypothetical protein